jgi:hypothetical protein
VTDEGLVRHIRADGTRLAYRAWGDPEAPPVVAAFLG